MQSIPFYDLTITDGFWKERQETVRERTVWAVYDQFRATGRIETMDCVLRPEGVRPHVFWGSDVFKWMEGACYLIKQQSDERLLGAVEEIIDMVEQGITPDGYYNSYFNATGEPRFTNRDAHELYSLGHMIEAGIAHFEATGSDRLLNLCHRNADLADRIFRVEQSAAFVTPGHEEIELALLRLYRTTGEKRYLDLAKFFIRQRGANSKDSDIGPQLRGKKTDPSYRQSHLPVTEQREAVGHAVRAVYLYCGMADLARETGDAEMLAAAKRLFHDIVENKMYITGGIGSIWQNEGFSVARHLPSRVAYAETCAALGLALFAGRLAAEEPDSRYADAAERALYNGMLAGLSLEGDAFFYSNPLEIDLARQDTPAISRSKFGATRQKVFSCSCCPPNLVRMIPSLGDWIYSFNAEYLYVHHYIPNTGRCDGGTVTLRTAYPAEGTVSVEYTGHKKLALRKPGWCRRYKTSALCREEKGYLYFETGTVTIEFDMTPCLIRAADDLHETRGRLAVQRGPIVYCLEGQDQQDDLFRCRIDPTGTIRVLKEQYGGLPVLETDGVAVSAQRALYAPYTPEKTRPIPLRLIPYYTFANRGADDMVVWITKK